jgi:response regulator RpfG family c-di-GMP phosphodiesterase
VNNPATRAAAAFKVVVIDDVETNLMLFSKVVAQLPETEAVTFTSSREALNWLGINEAVLIIVDQNMPELSGVEFITQLRDRGNSDTPIIMITGHADRELQRDALKRGASAFLGKPVDPVAFISLARNLIALRGARFASMAKGEANRSESASQAEALANQERTTLDTLSRIIDMRDPRSGDHCRRVALYSEAIGKKLNLSMIELVTLKQAARVHDIGKIAMPDRLLYKAGRLQGDERDVAKRHATDGAKMLEDFSSQLMRTAAEIARSHHERFDGSGYPSSMKGDAIPRFSRIVAVADTFSALTSRRPWREAAAVSIAVEQIERESGSGFEPRIVGAFRDAMPELLDIKSEIPDN